MSIRPLLTVAIGALLLLTGCATQSAAAPAVTVQSALTAQHKVASRQSHPIPYITSLDSFKGHPLLVDFFATSCMYCAYEATVDMPGLLTFAKQHHITVLAINGSATLGMGSAGYTPATGIDGTWTPTDNQATLYSNTVQWARKFHLLPYVRFNSGEGMAKEFHILHYGFPTLLVFDARGKLVKEWGGVQNNATVESAFLKLQ
ncbi:MAG: TlpA disulfide reductase family protein [Firmicutes bacterium]|nr:TlpA disulfide reductase family protein [Bacillota bacterium]